MKGISFASERITNVTDVPKDLKEFKPCNRSLWKNSSSKNWDDWVWQLKHRITDLSQIRDSVDWLKLEEPFNVSIRNTRLKFAVTPYFLCLIDPMNPNCPIKKQVIPSTHESKFSPQEFDDPCNEQKYSPVSNLVHRYPDRVLLLVTNQCATYCRFCTRSRMVSHGRHVNDLSLQIEYIRKNKNIRDVLISGGDPLILSDTRLDQILSQIRRIKHVEILRIGTRVPIFLPQRITTNLCNVLKAYHPIYINVHINHPNELTLESKLALEKLADAGVPLGSQTVLLKGINDDPQIMMALVHKLLICRVKPYYLYHCDFVKGSSHFRSNIETGINIINQLRGFTTGFGVPEFVIDFPGGGGKVIIGSNKSLIIKNKTLETENYEHKKVYCPI
jgi:lysine 2,3-aminomutase